ncbi:MAG: UDP-N-acetylmuramoyl-tripeptide--D-alanyl-D-alanine ligase, partial [Desulfamplus sp.]|nr:UDP-N-acetylmuramoyl-tripeptide--D-alanyl-D-alanine ligase [Desulfamplus sp.]
NPRSENPDAIIEDIVAGIKYKSVSSTRIVVEPDRAKAIEIAVTLSEPNDIIVAAGKGHETYQITNSGKIDFDDRIILRQALSKLTLLQKSIPPQMPIAWSVADIVDALQIDSSHLKNIKNRIFVSVVTDSRTIKKDELFVALKGDKFDGHNFIFDLIAKGIKGFVVDRQFVDGLSSQDKEIIDQNRVALFKVDDTLQALGMVAKFQRVRSGVKVVAITGSNGKTTTRGMVASIFEQHFNTLSTQGNLNNEVGVPLTLLKLSKAHEWAVIEMGMNHSGEIARLSKIASPDIAIITNTTDAHLEGLGDVEGVARAKAEITEGMNQNSTIIINIDDPRWQIISDRANNFPNIANKIFWSLNKFSNSNFWAQDALLSQDSITFSLCIDYKQERKIYENLKIDTPAHFMLQNGIVASVVGVVAGVPESCIKRGLLSFKAVGGRMRIVDFPAICETNGELRANKWLHIIDDTYNANPGSVKAALETLSHLSKSEHNEGEKEESIAVLGDMLELGNKSSQLHFEIGQKVAELGISRLYAYGDMASEIVNGAKSGGLKDDKILYGSKDKIVESLINHIQKIENGQKDKKGIWILIKGSRGMKMEMVTKAITNYANNLLNGS